MADSKRCFVIMGFGTKTDLATGRKLNLDKSYQALIKPVIENKGMICVRADEILHSGAIDLPMYQQLLSADIVVADLSTANANAFYELGIRHALRPRTTIVISEDQLCYPFDLNHILINKYTHLGDSIDYFEVLRFQKHLSETLDAVLNDNKPDSPVYTFLDDLIPPALKAKARAMAKQVGDAISSAQAENNNKEVDEDDPNNKTLALIVRQGEEAIKKKQYSVAKGLFNSALLIANCNSDHIVTSNNAYLMQRLALATYKSEEPDKISALREANALLEKLDIAHTNDSETVVLAGQVAKRLYEVGNGDKSLDDAILFFQRGYYLINNRYNGINLSYLLNCRASSSLDTTDDERIADIVWANRIRKDVLRMCEKDWNKILQRENNSSLQAAISDDLSEGQQAQENEQKFWILVNRAEANFGLGNMDEYNQARAEAKAMENSATMMAGFTKQVEELGKLMEKQHHLLNVHAEGVM